MARIVVALKSGKPICDPPLERPRGVLEGEQVALARAFESPDLHLERAGIAMQARIGRARGDFVFAEVAAARLRPHSSSSSTAWITASKGWRALRNSDSIAIYAPCMRACSPSSFTKRNVAAACCGWHASRVRSIYSAAADSPPARASWHTRSTPRPNPDFFGPRRPEPQWPRPDRRTAPMPASIRASRLRAAQRASRVVRGVLHASRLTQRRARTQQRAKPAKPGRKTCRPQRDFPSCAACSRDSVRTLLMLPYASLLLQRCAGSCLQEDCGKVLSPAHLGSKKELRANDDLMYIEFQQSRVVGAKAARDAWRWR